MPRAVIVERFKLGALLIVVEIIAGTGFPAFGRSPERLVCFVQSTLLRLAGFEDIDGFADERHASVRESQWNRFVTVECPILVNSGRLRSVADYLASGPA
jgi:hypothetical protein